MRFFLVILALVFLFSPPRALALEGHGTDSEQKAPALAGRARQVVAEAQGLIEKEKYDEAILRIETFLDRHPDRNHHFVEFTLANALALTNRGGDAMAHYRASVELFPGYAPSWLNLGKTAYDLEEYVPAGEALIKGFETSETKDPQTLYYGAVAYIMAEQEDRALPYLERLVSGELGEPEGDWFKALLMIYMEKGSTEKARVALARLVEIMGDDPMTWKLVSQFHLDRSEYKVAAAAMTIYSYLKPLNQDERILLGDLYTAAGVPLQATFYYREVVSNEGGPQRYQQLASAYLMAHRPQEAMMVLREALEADPTAKLWSMLGEVLYNDENYQEAFSVFARSTDLDPMEGRSYIMMAHCAIAMQDDSKAAQALGEALRYPKQKKRAQELMRYVASMQP